MRISNLFENDTQLRELAAGEVLFHAGDPGDAMYVVKEGEVDLFVADRLVETVGPEGIFGEMALMDNGRRTATALTRTGCKLMPINKRQFEFMRAEHPAFAVQVMDTLSARLRHMDAVLGQGA